MVYRSRAARPFSYAELQDLTRAAQSRNHREAITGVMVYDDPFFFQWLEGPWDSLLRVQESIRQDPRHTDFEILSETPIPARIFSGWDMKLATRVEPGGPWRRDVIFPPLTTLAELRRHPQAAPALLAKLACNPADLAATSGAQADLTRADSESRKGAILAELIHQRVLPELAARHGIAPVKAPPVIDQRVAELADLLLASHEGAALELIHEQVSQAPSAVPLYATLLEPAARRLGDLSREDVCSALELTIALSHLQTAVRLLGAESLHPIHASALAPSVLVVPLPGELHGLGAALDSEAMWEEGWSPQSEFPLDDEALQKLLSTSWFDVLDLSVSVALRREHWLPRLATTIAMARRASLNPGLTVMVGGRVFAEDAATAATVGANAASKTAANIVEDVLQGAGLSNCDPET
jgi:methanogenic corrinoid protein MtbC1